MNKLNNKIILLINKIAQYTVSGFYFWVYVVRGGIVYGLLPAGVGLIRSLEAIQEDNDSSLRLVFHEAYQDYKQMRWLSFSLFILTAFSFVGFNLNNSLIGFLQIPLMIFTSFLWIYFVYGIYFFAENAHRDREYSPKWIYALAFDTCIRHPLNSLVILITLIALSLVIRINAIAFIFFGPPLFIILTKRMIFFPAIFQIKQNEVERK